MPAKDTVADIQLGMLEIIHREFRDALVNKKYNGARLERYRQTNLWLEILIALGATTGTGVAGLAIWNQGYGTAAWAVISGISIVLSAIKPIVDLPKEITRYGKLTGDYASIFATFKMLEQDISAAGDLTSNHIERFMQARTRSAELAALDDPHPNSRLVEKMRDEVNRELPLSSLLTPDKVHTPNSGRPTHHANGEVHGEDL